MYSGTEYIFREAADADVPAIVDVVNRAFAIERFFKDGDRTDADGVRTMLRDGRLLLLLSGARLVSCIFVRQTGDRLYAGMLAADPDWKVPGVGPRMMDATESYARSSGCKWLDIRIVSVRPELKRLYRRRGFVETGTESGETINNLTQPVHFITLSKSL